MQSLSRILLVVERDQHVHAGLAKALALARHTGARLELFLCDTSLHPVADRDSNSFAQPQCRQRRAHDYLQSLRQGIAATDVPIEMQTACAATLLGGVIDRLRHAPAGLVVRTRGEAAGTSTLFAQRLVQAGTPIVVTQGRPWHASPQFMTALLVGLGRAQGRSDALIPLAQLPHLLGRDCGARMDYVVATEDSLRGVARRHGYDLIALPLRDVPALKAGAATPDVPDVSGISADLLFVAAVRASERAENADARTNAPL